MPKNISPSFKLFRNRYFIFFVAITITLLSGDIIMRQTLNKQNRDAELINIGGRQRMLSQRITKRVLYSYIDFKEIGKTPAPKLDTLSKLCTDFEAAHNMLLKECKTNNSGHVMSLLNTNTLYLTNIVEVCRQAVNNPNEKSFTYARKIVEQNELKFLLNQEEIVKLMVDESENKVSLAKSTEFFLTLLTIIFLILEFSFIVVPLIKQLKVSNSELKKAQEMLLQTGEMAKIGGWEVDFITNIVSWTGVTKQIHEVDDEFDLNVEKGINFYKEEESRDDIKEAVKKALLQEMSYDLELQIITKKGNEKWVRTKGTSVFENGKCVRLYGTIQDINNEKLKDILIEQSEELFRQTFNFSSIGIALVGLEGDWIMVNKSLCDIVGYSEAELLQTRFQEITHPDDLNEDMALIQKLIQKEVQSYQLEKRYYHKDGRIIWVLLTVSLVNDHFNKPLHFISQIIDITTTKHAEQIIKEERKLLQTLINNIPVNIFIKDLNSRKILVNKSEVEYMGLQNEADILGKDDFALFPFESAAISIAEDREVMNKNEPFFNKETTNLKYNSEAHYFLTSKIPLINDQNKVTGILGISYI